MSDEIMNFIEAVGKALHGKPRGELVDFVCPICGSMAAAYKSDCNGHMHAHCQSCGTQVME